MPISVFGSFSWYCSRAKIPVCSLLQQNDPRCYARNIEVGGLLIFQPAAMIITLGSFLMSFVMLSNIKSKYTAVGDLRNDIRKKRDVLIFLRLLAPLIDGRIIDVEHYSSKNHLFQGTKSK